MNITAILVRHEILNKKTIIFTTSYTFKSYVTIQNMSYPITSYHTAAALPQQSMERLLEEHERFKIGVLKLLILMSSPMIDLINIPWRSIYLPETGWPLITRAARNIPPIARVILTKFPPNFKEEGKVFSRYGQSNSLLKFSLLFEDKITNITEKCFSPTFYMKRHLLWYILVKMIDPTFSISHRGLWVEKGVSSSLYCTIKI